MCHRNGHWSKTVITESGPVEIAVPRDRAGPFEPQMARKRQRRLGGVHETVLSLSAKELTHGDISARLGRGVRRVDLQAHDFHAHRQRDGRHGGVAEPSAGQCPPVVFFDCVNVEVGDGHVANRPVCMAVAVNAEGHRDIPGLWIGDGGEGATYCSLSEAVPVEAVRCVTGPAGTPWDIGP